MLYLIMGSLGLIYDSFMDRKYKDRAKSEKIIDKIGL